MSPSTLALSLAFGGAAIAQQKTEVATFAGGCFWCVEADFDKVDGVISTTSGYIGGQLDNPTYKQVSAGGTGHAEAVEIVFDPAKVSYEKLLDVFWRNIDPVAKDRQFCDEGDSYRSAIFVHDDEQRRLAEELKAKLEGSAKLERSRSRPRSYPPAPSTRRRTTIRTITRRTPPNISSTAGVAGATSAWKSSGARRAARRMPWRTVVLYSPSSPEGSQPWRAGAGSRMTT